MADALLLWRRLVAAQIRSQLQYRLSFALDVLSSFAISFIDFLAVLVLFHNVPRLSTWSVHEVALLYAVSMISFSLTDLLVGHIDLLPQKVRDGSFDLLLVRPRGTLLQVTALDFQLRRVGKAAQGALVLAYALGALHVDWTLGRVLVLVLAVPGGMLIFGSVWVIGSCLSFWTTESGEFTNAFTYGGNFLTQYPIDIFSAWARRFLAYLVPMAFVAYLPSLYVLSKPDPLGLPGVARFASLLVGLVAACVAGLVWQTAVRHYRSAGG